MASGLRVAVTGAAGSVGAMLVERLAASDDVDGVVAFDNRPLTIEHPKVARFHMDIRQPYADILREYGVDALVHLAFLLRPGRNREFVRRVNVGGTAQTLRACKEAGVRQILYFSSTTVYGPHRDDPLPYTEESPVRPVRGFQYAEDKAATELMLDAFMADNPDTCVTVLRGCVIMGPRSDNFIAQAFRKPFLVSIAGADPQMQFMHEDDAQEALELCLFEHVPGVYNITGQGTAAFSEVAQVAGRRSIAVPAPLLTFLTQASWALQIQSDSQASGLTMMRFPWFASNEKFTRETGFRPRYTSREALEASTLARHAQGAA
ncbi:MAG: NAD-dependent epimerase/dehydratase family protein [Chloroflexi bacterium]|nr:NAD-dependent epimerase/dehydratase family protein [Chloroflexota bacterium]